MAWYHRFWNVVRPGRMQRDLDRELSFHVAERAAELQAGGMRAGSPVRWLDTDHTAIAQEANACKYVIPELNHEDTPIRSAYNSASLQVSGSLPAIPICISNSIPSPP